MTLTWWHNGTNDPAKSVWQSVADGYHAAHSDVSFKVEPLQNEQFSTKVPLALQSSDPPSIFQQWGGGDERTQLASGKLMDMSGSISDWVGGLGKAAEAWQVDGKWYGVPFDLHAVGFWYRKDLFARAGIQAPPTTMDEFNAAVAKLKAANIAPVALGGKDKWPDAFWWDYFAVRECSKDVLQSSMKNIKLEDPCFVKAGQDLKALLDTKPFQNAFLGASAQQGAGSSAGLVANGKAAMELQGDWELPTMIPLTKDKAYASKLGWFPFPAVNGGAGDPKAVLGGGDGYSCTTKATSACPDFLKYMLSTEVQTKLVQSQTATLPANPAANSAVTDASLKQVLNSMQSAPYLAMYFDRALPTSVGQALNDAIANFFAGQGTPESIVAAANKAAADQ
ncbi:ABC transporter substrate-binding protein [Plantactinospora siamensis]|uniref:ABC transporter substrate-binding protein n=1 Tax=Plantactinospora siamensis TaxID=555372 RepID=UPI0035EBE0C5